MGFTWPNLCSLNLSLLFIVLVGLNFVPGICKLKPKKKLRKPKNLFFVKKLGFPALLTRAFLEARRWARAEALVNSEHVRRQHFAPLMQIGVGSRQCRRPSSIDNRIEE